MAFFCRQKGERESVNWTAALQVPFGDCFKHTIQDLDFKGTISQFKSSFDDYFKGTFKDHFKDNIDVSSYVAVNSKYEDF